MPNRRPLPPGIEHDRRADDVVARELSSMEQAIRRLGQRVAGVVTFLLLISGVFYALGWRWVSPGDGLAQTTAHVAILAESTENNSRRLTAVEGDVTTTLYLACALFRQASPGAVLPEKCQSDRIQRQRVR